MERIARLETVARLGYLGRAIVYLRLGYLTLATAHAEGTATVLEDIKALPAGTLVLLATAAGLAAYGLFRGYGALVDLEGDGSNLKGAGKRLGHAASGIAHLILAFLAVKLVLWGGASDGSGGTKAARTVMDFPGGEIVIGAVGVGFGLAALNQAAKAASARFMDLLEERVPAWVEIVGRIGYAARAAVFASLGWQLVRSAWGGETRAVGFQPALEALQELELLYTAVAAGLLVFGLFSLVMARYRKVRNGHVIDRILSGSMKPF